MEWKSNREIDKIAREMLFLEIRYRELEERMDEIQANCPHEIYTICRDGIKVCDICEKEL
jgi:hypothetical protein